MEPHRILFRVILCVVMSVGLLGYSFYIGSKYEDWREIVAIMMGIIGVLLLIVAGVGVVQLFRPWGSL